MTAPPAPAPPAARHLLVPRTARYYLLGEVGAGTREMWVALHGYAQLAGRFARPFAVLAGETRAVVVPEALNRFYVGEWPRRSNADQPVGATWMTREDREAEIADQVRYLDALCAHLLAGREADGVAVHVLGFSQGTATAARWLALGATRARRLVLWGGTLPHDLDLAAHADTLRALRLTLVVGDGDEFATPERVAAETARLRAHEVPFELVTYAGGHAVDAEVLGRIATE